MPFLVQKRYLCTNVPECRHACSDRIFSERDYKLGQGHCAPELDGCGAALVETKSRDRRLPILAATTAGLAAAGFAGVQLKSALFPEPASNIAFEQAISEVDESARSVDITVVRSGNLDKRQRVRFATAPGLAQADIDYATTDGIVEFAPGSGKQVITIAILPDADVLEQVEDFSVQLFEVLGNPVHRVMIGTGRAARTEYDAALSEVRALSALSIDIAKYVVKLEGLQQIIEEGVDMDSVVQKAFFKKYNDLKENQRRAQQRYVEILSSFTDQDSTTVAAAFDHWVEYLLNQDHEQQAAATRVARDHLRTFVDQGGLLDDDWPQQLGALDVIPRIELPTADGATELPDLEI